MNDANPLWVLIQRYMDDSSHRYSPSAADLARETGVSDQVISKWKKKPTLPTPEQLMAFSTGTGIDYLDLLEAALEGRGYLPQAGAIGFKIRGGRFRAPVVFNRPEDGGEHGGDTAATKTNVTPLSAPAANVPDVAKAADADERGEQSAVAEQGEPDSP